ncbi:MATE family efflux transporter [Clostridium fungisolvens]|uniref:Multidrug export protein MepA n=1 Tax=Clostridium fungisolvens TaxID=1604897 RepID=A0A6V8SP03_9CLOT|nr:MATE family efflux transporter [Clostridium fungisolvens]GFP76593.1 Multidrug export protein MepA [Clostridium fungisolvens]
MEHKSEVNKLGKEKLGKLLISLALPAIIAQLVNMLYNIVDRIYIGHIPNVGADALTGVGVTFPIIMIISAFSALIGIGGAPRASIRMGQNKHEEAEQILGNCFVALIGISIILTLLFFAFGKKLLLMFGASAETLPYALSFLNIYILGTIFVQIALGLNTFISTQGFAKISMLTVTIGAVVSFILDPIFIFGLNMGVQGAAAANVIAQACSAIWTLKFLFGHKSKLRIRRKNMHLRKTVLVPVLMLGSAPFVMQSTESLLNIAFNSSLQKYGGDMAVGAMTIMSSLMQILSLPLSGLGQGAQPIMSYNYGAKNNDRVKNTFKLLILYSVSFALVFWIFMMVFPEVFVSIFSTDAELSKVTVWAIRIYMAVAFLMSAQTACQQTFIALGQAKSSLFLAILRKIILLIPLIFILPNFFDDKVFAVFIAEPVADFMAVSTTVSLFAIQFKKVLAKNIRKENSEIAM